MYPQMFYILKRAWLCKYLICRCENIRPRGAISLNASFNRMLQSYCLTECSNRNLTFTEYFIKSLPCFRSKEQ